MSKISNKYLLSGHLRVAFFMGAIWQLQSL
nr:MAG TPA: protein of unknown function (UPF0239) [Caudoviricetes sp.]